MIEHFEEKILGDLDAALKVTGFGNVEQVGDLLELLSNSSTVAVLVSMCDKLFLVGQE